jgi:hypothetical protein
MNKIPFVSTIATAAVLLSALSANAQAAAILYTGDVLAATGALAGLITPIPQPMSGTVTYDDAAIAGGLAGPSDVTDVLVEVGAFCFALDILNCPAGSAAVPVTSIDSAAVTFSGGEPTGGSMQVTAFSATFGVSIPISFDLSAGSFLADAGALGTVSGTFSAPAPAVLGPFDPNKVPTMPIYGLIITGLGLLLVAGRRLRAVQSRS